MAHARTTNAGRVKKGQTAWHKDLMYLIKVKRTARGWRRLRVINLDVGTEFTPRTGIFYISPWTEFLTKKLVQEIFDKKEFDLKA